MRDHGFGLLEADVPMLQFMAQHSPVSLPVVMSAGPRPAAGKSAREHLAELQDCGWVLRHYPNGKERAGMYSITDKGREAIADVETGRASVRPAQALETSIAGPRRPHTGGYQGAELKPYSGRPGALDAYRLPSLVNGQRVERTRAPIIVASTRRDRLQDGRGGR